MSMRLDLLPGEVLERIVKDVLYLQPSFRQVGWISVLNGDAPSLLALSHVNKVLRQSCLRVAMLAAPLDCSRTRDIGSMRKLIDTFPSPSTYFDQIQKAQYFWENSEAADMGWMGDPKGGPLDHAFMSRKDWQYAEAVKELEECGDEIDRDMEKDELIEQVFGDRIYTHGPDGAMQGGDGYDLDERTHGVVPGIASIRDVEKTLADVFSLCASLRWLQWSALTYPLPKGLADSSDRSGTLETVIMSNEQCHRELEMSSVPRCARNLFFCYSPTTHRPSGAADDSTPVTPWLQYSAAAPLGVELIESKSPQRIHPAPPNVDNTNRLNAWVATTRKNRLLYWICQSVMNGLESNNLRLVGLLTSLPLELPSMLPIWLSVDQVVHARQAGIAFANEDLTEVEEVSQRGIALQEMRRELHFGEAKATGSTAQSIRNWAKAEREKDCQKGRASFYRREMAGWMLEDEELSTAIAIASHKNVQ